MQYLPRENAVTPCRLSLLHGEMASFIIGPLMNQGAHVSFYFKKIPTLNFLVAK